MTFDEIIADKSKFPDESEVTLADGSKVQLGQIRGAAMKDADYRKKTSDLANSRRQLEEQQTRWEEARLDAEARLTQMAQQLIQRGQQPPTRDDVDEYLENDPVAKKLQAKLDAATAKLDQLTRVAQAHEQALGTVAQTYVRDQHLRALADLQSRDKDLDAEDFLQYARDNRYPNLYNAYKAYSFDKKSEARLAAAKEEGIKEGMEKAKKELNQPLIRSRRVMSGPDTGGEKAPKDWDEAMESALADDEVMQTFQPGGQLY